MMTSALAVVGLMAALAAPAVAQERVWKGNSKRGTWVEVPVKPAEEPTTFLVAVAPGEQKEGDVLGVRTVGKHLERVYFRAMPKLEAAVAKGHACSLRVTTVMKHLEYRHFCRVDGAEQPCPGMSRAGECLAVVK
jgi:hypothetical protein